MNEKTAAGYARELVASLWHSFPEDAEQPIAEALAAAEERGRRRGLEERDGLRALCGLQEELLACYRLGKRPPDRVLDGIRAAKAALAPRDSGKEGQQ